MSKHTPPASVQLRAVSLVPYPYGGASLPSWRLTLRHFTRAILSGPNPDRLANTQGKPLHDPLSVISLGNLAHWLFQSEPPMWEYGGVVQKINKYGDVVERFTPTVAAMLELLDAHPGNEKFRHLLYVDPGKIVTSIDGEDVVLFLEQRHGKDPLDNLELWYSQRKKEAAAQFAEVECADFNASLGKHIDAMDAVYSRRQAITRSLVPLMSRLQAGDQIIGIVEAFGRRPRDRPDRHPWRDHGSKQFVQPQPDEEYQKRLRNFRTVEWKTPLDVCYALINDQKINDDLEAAAGDFIKELRDDGAAYLDYLRNFSRLHANSRAIVRQSMQRGFELALLTEVGRDALVNGELNTLLRLTDAAAPVRSRRGGARVMAVENFRFDDWLGDPEPNPLGKAVAESWTGKISDSLDGGSFVLGLLSHGVVAVVQEGRRLGVVEEPLYAMLFRQVAAVTRMTAEHEDAFEAALDEFSRTGKFSAVKDVFFDEKTGVLAPAAKVSSIALKFVTMTAKLILLYHSVSEARKAAESDAPLDVQLAWFKTIGSVVEVAGVGTDLIATFSDTTLVKEAAKRLSVNTNSLGAVSKCLGVVEAFLSFMISAAEYQESFRKRRTSNVQEEKWYAAAFDAVKCALIGGAAAFGAAESALVAALALAIMTAKYAVTNLDSWVPHVPFVAISKKTAPHRLLEGLLHEMLNDHKHGYPQVLSKVKARLGAKNAEHLDTQVRNVHKLLSSPVRTGNEIFWDIAPPKIDGGDSYAQNDADRPNIEAVRHIIGAEWGVYDDKTLKRLVQHSK